MRKLCNWERYVQFPKTNDNPLEGEIPLNIAQKEVRVHKAWMKPVAFIRSIFGALMPMFRTTAVSASGQVNPFFGNPSTALRVGFDSLPKDSRSAVEQQSKTTRTTLEEESKRSRRTLEQHPNESRRPVQQQTSLELPSFPRTLLSLPSKVVHSYPEQVLRTRQVCVKYALSTDIVLNEHSIKALISAVRWPYAMAILYNIARIFKAIAHKNSTSTIQNLYYANTTDRDNTLPGTYQVLPASDRHGFSTASRRLRAPITIGARSENDQSAKPEMQNKGRRKVEQKQNTVRTTSGRNVIKLRSLYQKATVSIRVTYQKYTLDLLKTYQRLTKKLPTRYQEVGNKPAALYRNATANLHAFGSLTVASARRVRLLPSKGSAVFSTFLLYLVVLFSDAQAQSAGERAVEGLTEIRSLNFEKFTNIDLNFEVSYRYFLDRENYKHTLRVHPWADLVRFPLISYNLDYTKTPNVRIRDSIPFIVESLPFQYVDAEGKVNIGTLADFSKDKLLILDFWATWCAPCVKSMDKWNEIAAALPDSVAVIGVMLDFDYKAQHYGMQRNWRSPILFGPQAYIFNSFFFNQQAVSRMAWIKDGKLVAITGTKGYDLQMVKDLLAGKIVDIPMELDWSYSTRNK